MTSGKTHDLEIARTLSVPKGSCLVFDRGYTGYAWYGEQDKKEITFITRLKRNSGVCQFSNRRKPDSEDVLSDYKVKLPGHQFTFRQITYRDPETGKVYRFLTNSKKLKTSEIAALYKERWKIELFFKWIKQNLKVKTFLGTSQDAVLTQLWIALCVYLLLCFFKFMAKFKGSISEILRLLQLNLFEKRPFTDLLKPPDKVCNRLISPQLSALERP